MANNRPVDDRNPAAGNANAGGASTAPDPNNAPLQPDPTVDETRSTPEDTGKDQKEDRANEASNRQADLDKREADLKAREEALAAQERRPNVSVAQTQAEITQRQIEDSQKVLDGSKKKVNLKYQHTNVTAAGVVKYGPGEVEVPEPFAEDLERRDAEHNDYQVGLHQRRENLLFSGTISGAGK